MKKIFCIGEILIDFIAQPGHGLDKTRQFIKLAGGAPANVAVAAAKLGGEAAFIGNIGADSFGTYLCNVLAEFKIDMSLCTHSGKSTLAFVAIDEQGERNFEFYRGSDEDFKLRDIDLPATFVSNIIHFGSATAFLGGYLRSSYFQMLDYASENNMFISFDPNYRENLITSDELPNFIHDCNTFIACADLVKLNEIEAQLISGEDDLKKSCQHFHDLGAKNVVITLGSKGCLLSNHDGARYIPSRKLKKQVDSTGAGDAFIGALLYKLALHDEPNWDAFVVFANFVGAYTCCSYGAISAMPNMRQFLDFVG